MGTPNSVQLCLEHAEQFLITLAEGDPITFQWFADHPNSAVKPATLTEEWDEIKDTLESMNRAGAGIYAMINEGDGKGRKTENVIAVRALFLDLDGAPLEPVQLCPVEPHIIIESSPARYHCYWLVEDCPLTEFTVLQQALAKKFNGDPSVKDLPRVMRLPGFAHWKTGTAFISKLIEINLSKPVLVQEFTSVLGLDEYKQAIEKERRAPLSELDELFTNPQTEGGRHDLLMRYASKYAHNYGLGYHEVRGLIGYINQHACKPPKTNQQELDSIADQAIKYAAAKNNPLPNIDIDAIIKASRKISIPDDTYRDFPEEILFGCPGLVGKVARFIRETAFKPQPEMAVGAALCAVATVIGRKVCTESDGRSNLYVMALGETGTGKEAPRQAIRAIFEKIEAPQRSAVNNIASDSAIAKTLEQCPSQVFLLDEFGASWQTLSSPTAGPHLKTIPKVFLELFSSANTVYRSKEYATDGLEKKINHPNLSIYCTSVPKSFYDGISHELVTNGLLNRFLLMRGPEDDPPEVSRPRSLNDIPEDIIEGFTIWENASYRDPPDGGKQGLESVELLIPNPRVIRTTAAAWARLEEFKKGVRKDRAALKPLGLGGIYGRSHFLAWKVAMIVAAGCDPIDPLITEEHVSWAIKLVEVSTWNFQAAMQRHVPSYNDSPWAKWRQRIIEILREVGVGGISKTELRVRSSLAPAQLNSILNVLIDEEERVEQFKLPGKTRPRVMYRYVSNERQ